jgi:hypothetical protein
VSLVPAGRLGSHAIAAMFVILLTAFGVFCSYYPWKIPPVQQSTHANAANVLSASSTGELRHNYDKRQNRARNQKKP